MRQPLATTAPPPPRSNSQYRWTRDKMVAFLRALTERGSVAAAARSVGMSRASVYLLRARLTPEFGALWDDGVMLGRARRQARRRALYGGGGGAARGPS